MPTAITAFALGRGGSGRPRVLELAPVYWRETLEQEDAQQILGVDLCRLAMVDLDGHSGPK